MRSTTATFAVLAVTWAAAWADRVEYKEFPYTDVVVNKVQDGTITFRLAGGREISKDLKNVTLIWVAGLEGFNQAEEKLKSARSAAKMLKAGKAPKDYEQARLFDRANLLYKSGKKAEGVRFYRRGLLAQAVDLYARAGQSDGKTWLKLLTMYRRLSALELTGAIERSVAEWLKIIEAVGATPASLALGPGNFAPKGSQANDRAAAKLTAALDKAKTSRHKQAIRQLLLRLYGHQGTAKEHRGLAQDVIAGGGKAADEGGKPTASAAIPPAGGALPNKLDALEALLQAGQARQVLQVVQKNLRRYKATDLPLALLLIGRAKFALADKAGDPAQRRGLLIQAGLQLMRVPTYYAASGETAAEALYCAGRVNLALGNRPAARNAFEMVRSRGSEKWGPKAAQQLDAMVVKDESP